MRRETAMYTNQEVIEILNSIKEETDKCVGFIAGMVTKDGFII